MKEKNIHDWLYGFQNSIIVIGTVLSVISIVYELVLHNTVTNKMALYLSLGGMALVVFFVNLLIFIYGLKLDKSKRREDMLKGTRQAPMYIYMAVKILYVKYKVRTRGYLIVSCGVLGAIVAAAFFDKYLYSTIMVLLTSIFLALITGSVKNAEMMTVFPRKYREDIEKLMIENYEETHALGEGKSEEDIKLLI